MNKWLAGGSSRGRWCFCLAVLITMWLVVIGPLPAEEFMDVDGIQTGDKGYGLTAFSGRRIERFEVIVLGVLRGAFMGGDMILAKLAGGPLEKTGVIAGMSGSPVYIDNKLIGAVAYGWTFAKEAICGITPIEEMLELRKRLPEEKQPGQDEPPTGMGRLLPGTDSGGTSSFTGLRMIETPVVFTGFPEQVVEHAAKQLKQFGMVPMQSGSDGQNPYPKADTNIPGSISGDVPGDNQFLPGAPLGVALVTGDLNITGVGTMTYRDESLVLGFGHPMFGFGPVDLPMTHASVITCLPSLASSFKITGPGPVIGRVIQDRRPAIMGVVGEESDILPFSMELIFEKNEKKTFNVLVARNEVLTPWFMEWVLDGALIDAGREMGKMTLKTKLVMDIEDHGRLVFEDGCAAESFPMFLSSMVLEAFQVLWTNSLGPLHFNSVSVDVRVEEEYMKARLEEVRLGKIRVEPGETVTVSVVLHPHRGRRIVETLSIQIPASARPGEVELVVSDADTALENEKSRSPKLYEPETVERLISTLKMKQCRYNVVVSLAVPTEGLMVGDREMPDLPGSMRNILTTLSGGGRVSPLVQHADWSVRTDYIIEGNLSAELEIVAEESDF